MNETIRAILPIIAMFLGLFSIIRFYAKRIENKIDKINNKIDKIIKEKK